MKKSRVKEEPKRKKKKIFKIVILLILLILIIGIVYVVKRTNELGGGASGFLATMLGHDEHTAEELGTIYCLVMGESETNTDTIMLASYNPATQAASIMSIPRDTFVGDNENRPSGYDKINALYRGTTKQETDAMRTVKAVEEITGLEIPYYAVIDTKGVRQLVDLLGRSVV